MNEPAPDSKLPNIKRFHQINSWLYRGGQPTRFDLESLKEFGVRTIVCLRWTSSIVAAERELAREIGLNFVPIPLTYWVFPTKKEIDRFLQLCDDPSKHPIFLHCKYGVDRTGVFIAMYRMAREGWSAKDAYQEMRDAGHHKIRMHQLKWAVYGFENRLKRSRKTEEQ